MKKNDFENEYREYRELADEFEAIDKATDSDDDLDEIRDKMNRFFKRLEEKGKNYVRVFEEYIDARNHGNQYIDLNDSIWDERVPGLIEGFRELGIDRFTFSSAWSSAVDTAWLFTENGCRLEGLIQINGTNHDWKTGEYDKKPAYLFSIQ